MILLERLDKIILHFLPEVLKLSSRSTVTWSFKSNYFTTLGFYHVVGRAWFKTPKSTIPTYNEVNASWFFFALLAAGLLSIWTSIWSLDFPIIRFGVGMSSSNKGLWIINMFTLLHHQYLAIPSFSLQILRCLEIHLLCRRRGGAATATLSRYHTDLEHKFLTLKSLYENFIT